MDNSRRLALLKAHRLDLSGGPVFENQQHCVDWVNKVAPLLRYDTEHYHAFQHYGYYMGLRSLSVGRRMQYIGELNGIVGRAIIELENGIVPEKAVDPPPKEPESKTDPIEPPWYKSALTLALTGIAIPVLMGLVYYWIKQWFGIDLK